MNRSDFINLINLQTSYIPPGKHNRPGSIMRPTSITIHNTDNTSRGADAIAHIGYLNNVGHYIHNGQVIWTSWHYTVDDKRVVNHLPIDEVSYHAGNAANTSSVSIEVCMNTGIDRQVADKRAARIAALLLYDLRLGRDNIKSHKNWTGKQCPSLLLAGSGFESFKDAIMAELSTIDGAADAARPAIALREPMQDDSPIEMMEDVGHPQIPNEYLSPE